MSCVRTTRTLHSTGAERQLCVRTQLECCAKQTVAFVCLPGKPEALLYIYCGCRMLEVCIPYRDRTTQGHRSRGSPAAGLRVLAAASRAHLRVAHVRLHPVPQRARAAHVAQVQEANLRQVFCVRQWSSARAPSLFATYFAQDAAMYCHRLPCCSASVSSHQLRPNTWQRQKAGNRSSRRARKRATWGRTARM